MGRKGDGENDAGYVLEGQRWSRLWLLFAASFISAGIGPGAAAWVPLFANAGVFGSVCSSDAGADGTCEEQKVSISGILQVGGIVTMIGVLYSGYYFDRFGANFCGRVGAMIAAVGLLLLTIVVWGAESGYDAQTSGLLLPAIFIADAGGMLNSYCICGLVYHFPDYQSLILAVMTAAFQGPAVLPTLIAILQSWTNISLGYVFFAWVALAVLSYFICRSVAPSVKEYDDYAQRMLGFAPRTNTAALCTRIKDGHSVLRPNWVRHTLMAVSLAALSNGATFYLGLSSVYEDMLLEKGAGEVLPQHFAVYAGGLSILCTPVLSYIGDNWGSAFTLKIYMVLMVLLPLVTASLVATPTWPAQEVCGASMGMIGVIINPFITKYGLAYAVPSRLGIVIGVICMWMTVVMMVALGATYAWMSFLPNGSLEQLLVPIRGASWVGAAAWAAWSAHCLYVGLPTKPVLLPQDEEEIAAAHGFTNLDEMAREAGLKNRDELISKLGGEGIQDLQHLKGHATAKQSAPSSSGEESSEDWGTSTDESDESIAEGRLC